MISALDLAYKNHISSEVEERVRKQQKAYDYYSGNEERILSYLDDVLAVTFDPVDIESFQKDYLNITEKIVDELAVVYREPAERKILIDGKVDEEWTEYYNGVLPVDVNSSDKAAHRQARLTNVSLTYVSFNLSTGKIEYKIVPTYVYHVRPDDNDDYRMLELCYTKKYDDEWYVVVWTDKEHYRVPILSAEKVMGDREPVGNGKMKNNYGRIPVSQLRLKKYGDFWGEPMSDVINTSEQINFLLTDLTNGGVIMQSWGTPFMVNTGLAGNKNKVRVGPKHAIAVDKVPADEQEPIFEYKNANPLIKEVQGVIDWKIKLIALSRGLNPQAFMAEVKASSGFSKVMDRVEQFGITNDDVESCRVYEDERFDITRRVNNYYANTKQGRKWKLKVIPDNAYLQTDFQEPEMPNTTEEQQKEDEWGLKYNLVSVIDIAKRKNPDLTEEELKNELEENKKINELYRPKSAQFGDNDNGQTPAGATKSDSGDYGNEDSAGVGDKE